jgi:hypothetical protein
VKLSKWEQHKLDMMKKSAPADEYFGRMKMSFLGMNNTFRDAAISAGDHTTDAAIARKVELAEDALEDWAKRYPQDPQLARTYFLATVVEQKIWIHDNQERAWHYLHQVRARFANTYFGKLAKKELEIGFTEHYFDVPAPCPTPVPELNPNQTLTSAAGMPLPQMSQKPIVPEPRETMIAVGLRAEILPPACEPIAKQDDANDHHGGR